MRKIAADRNYRMFKRAENKGPRKFTEAEVSESAFALALNEGWEFTTTNTFQNRFVNHGLKVERPVLKEEHYYDEFSQEKLEELYFNAAKERMIETNDIIYPLG